LVDNLTAHVSRQQQGWQFDIPNAHHNGWQPVAARLAGLCVGACPGNGGANDQRSDELRVRASRLDLNALDGMLPIAEKISPELGKVWRTMAPAGLLENLALDIPLQATEKTRFQARWKNISWKQWELLPGVENLSGTLSGSVENGRVTIDMAKAKCLMPPFSVRRWK
jgi:uncharacterized protein YhdP